MKLSDVKYTLEISRDEASWLKMIIDGVSRVRLADNLEKMINDLEAILENICKQ